MYWKKTLGVFAIVIAVAVAGIVVWRIVTPSTTSQPLTVESVRKQLERATPLGSRRTAVERYLDSQSIPHSYVNDPNVPNERGMELALVRGTSKSQFVRGDIQIRFQFDESDRLLNYSVQEMFTGP